MEYPPAWMWIVAVVMVIVGIWLSRRRVSKTLAHLPGWFCALLVLVALLGMWFLLNAQFGGQAIHIPIP